MSKENITSIRWEAENLPAGLYIDTDTGTISGNYNPTVKVTTNYGTDSEPITVNATVPIVGLKGEKGDKGDTGAQGPQGIQGSSGNAATITVGTVTTGAAGSSAKVTNSGTTSAAVLNFTIPKGDKGDTGVVFVDFLPYSVWQPDLAQSIIDNPELYEGRHFLQTNNPTTLDSTLDGTIFKEAPHNSIVTYSNGQWDIYIPKKNDCIIMLGTLSISSSKASSIDKFNGEEWEILFSLTEYVKDKNIVYVFDAGYGDTLPATAKRGSKFLKQENGYLMAYTAVADNIWDNGFRLYKHSVKKASGYYSFNGRELFQFNASKPTGIQTPSSIPEFHEGMTVQELATGDIFLYSSSAYGMCKSNTEAKIRHVTDIITQVYDTAPTNDNPPAEDNVLMINENYMLIYTNTDTTTRWRTKTSAAMPTNKSYLSLADKRILGFNNGLLTFAPLLDGEMFYYEGDKNYYIYRLSTNSFVKVGTTAATLTATLQ